MKKSTHIKENQRRYRYGHSSDCQQEPVHSMTKVMVGHDFSLVTNALKPVPLFSHAFGLIALQLTLSILLFTLFQVF